MFETEDMKALRAAVNAHFDQFRPTKTPPPDAPGCAGLSEKARDEASTRYGQVVMAKPAGQLSADERAFLKQGIASWAEGSRE
jgi:hypothetical protein